MHRVLSMVLGLLLASSCSRASIGGASDPADSGLAPTADQVMPSDLDAGRALDATAPPGAAASDAAPAVGRPRDAGQADATSPPPDAGSAPPGAPQDASLGAVQDASVEGPTVDASTPPDAGAPEATQDAAPPDTASDAAVMCDLGPCEGHCLLLQPCCDSTSSCACREVFGACVLPPL